MIPSTRFLTFLGVLLVTGVSLSGSALIEDPRLTRPGPLLEWNNDRPPNIVFILSDDQGWNQVGYHGFEFYETPNIDRLARDGISFTNAYASSPICSPTRAGLMTGKHPARLHLTVHLSLTRDLFVKPLLEPIQSYALPLEETTLPEMLKTLGYATGHFGKWHLSLNKEYRPGRIFDPESQGFDDVLTTMKPESDLEDPPDAHSVETITDRAIQFIERNQERPFFCYVPHHVVHRPLYEDSELVEKYRNKPGSDLPENSPVMGAMIERMDAGIGRILDTLDRLGLSENTLVVFMSDNGGYEELQDQAPLRGGKAMLYEGGIRVPLALRWPGVIPPGRTSDEPVVTHDFFPTIMSMAGLPYVPDRLDGIDLFPLLQGKTERLSREALYWHLPNYHHQGVGPQSAIRWGDWKLVENLERSQLGQPHAYELFNLARDPGEQNDLADSMPAVTQKLQQKLSAWKEEAAVGRMPIRKEWPPFDVIDDPEPPALPPLPGNR